MIPHQTNYAPTSQGPATLMDSVHNHESPKITKLYDRTSDQIDLDEIERIRI
jgi:hypothetical protein